MGRRVGGWWWHVDCSGLHVLELGPCQERHLKFSAKAAAPAPSLPRSDLLSGTRSSRLYRSLVLNGKALTAAAYSSYPADKHPTTFSIYSIPSKGG